MLDQSGPLVLIVEDEFMIAFEHQDNVLAAGMRVGGPFPSSALAVQWLDGHTPDMAILDVLLADRDCLPVSQVLRRRGIPWIVVTGVERSGVSAAIAGEGWLTKPCSSIEIIDRLKAMANRRPNYAAEMACAEQSAN